MEERKEKGTWIGDLLARIVFQTGTGLCALMLGILVPGFGTESYSSPSNHLQM